MALASFGLLSLAVFFVEVAILASGPVTKYHCYAGFITSAFFAADQIQNFVLTTTAVDMVRCRLFRLLRLLHLHISLHRLRLRSTSRCHGVATALPRRCRWLQGVNPDAFVKFWIPYNCVIALLNLWAAMDAPDKAKAN